MKQANQDKLRVVVFKEGDVFIAQCLEHDICVQAPDMKTLRHRMDVTLDAERDFARANNKQPFEGIDPAPEHFFDAWDKAWGTENSSNDVAICA